MKNFLVSIDKITSSFSLLQSSNIALLEQENLLILCSNQTQKSLIKMANSYLLEGIGFLKDIQGAFTFLLYDKIEKKLFIAKDKVGIEPLYFYHDEKSIIVGTTLKAFHKVQEFKATINPSSIGEYLQFGFILQPNTIFKNTHKVSSGEYLSFDLKNDTYSAKYYWRLEDAYDKGLNPKSEAIIIKETHKLLEESIEKHCKQSSFGLSLSGGYDSSTLVALAQKQSHNKVATFTIGFHDKNIDEAPHAKAIAKHLGTNHTEYYFGEKDALNLIPKMSKIYDEPFADHAAMPTILTSQLLKQHSLSTLIAGDGGDEVFATAENVHLFHYLQKSPKTLKRVVATLLNSIEIRKVPYLKELNNLPKKQQKLTQLLLAKSIPQMVYARNTLFLEEELQATVRAYRPNIETSFDRINFSKNTQTVNQVIGSYFKTTMVDGELMKSYAAMNHQSIKFSTPFLEMKLIEYMATIPSKVKIKNSIKKYILKEIAHHYIPKSLIERPKSGFDIPFSEWMRGVLKELLYAQINKQRLNKDNIFYTSSILNIRDQFYAGNDAYKYKLWRVFIFQLWYETFQQITKE